MIGLVTIETMIGLVTIETMIELDIDHVP